MATTFRASASRTPCTRRSSSRSSGATSSRRPPDDGDPRQPDRDLHLELAADPPRGRGDPHAPGLLRGAADGQAAGGPAVSMLRALGRYIDTDAWTWICYPTGQFLFHPPNVAGWDDTRWLDTSRMRARWNMVHYALRGVSVNAWNNTYSTTETAERRWLARRPPGAASRCSRARCRVARLRPHRAVASDGQLAARPLPGPAPERPPTADRRLRRCDAGMSRGGHNHCGDYTRSQLFRTAAAQAGAGLPAIEPGAPIPRAPA